MNNAKEHLKVLKEIATATHIAELFHRVPAPFALSSVRLRYEEEVRERLKPGTEITEELLEKYQGFTVTDLLYQAYGYISAVR